MVASAVVVDQYQNADQTIPERTSIAVGTTISHGRDFGESCCVFTLSPRCRHESCDESCAAPLLLLAKPPLSNYSRRSCTFLTLPPMKIFGSLVTDRSCGGRVSGILNASRHGSSGCTGRCVCIRTFIAAPRKSPASCSA